MGWGGVGGSWRTDGDGMETGWRRDGDGMETGWGVGGREVVGRWAGGGAKVGTVDREITQALIARSGLALIVRSH